MPGKEISDNRAHRQDPEQLKNLLLVLEHARADAWLRRDERALEALLDADYLEINLSGLFTRDDLLLRFFPRVLLHTITIEDPVLFPAGAGTAALTYQCYEEFTIDGRKMKGTYRVSSLYRWNGRQWKLALRQITPFHGR